MVNNTTLPLSHLNGTQYAPVWVPEPNGRGTWSILYSCTFTLSLCVWSAIHLNIPPRGEPERTHLWRKTKWLFIAIFAPEFVLYTAWQQYLLAQIFCDEFYNLRLKQEGLKPRPSRTSFWTTWTQRVQKLLYGERRKKDEPGDQDAAIEGKSDSEHQGQSAESALPSKFSLTFGFYVVMGGITVDVSDIYDDLTCMTISLGGVLRLAELTSWKNFFVDDEVIRDKSKADNFAKVLVILQVTYTFLQCISRKSAGLPLSVLEVHTLVHAGCAMIMYAFWFRKPLDIRDSTKINTSDFADVLALTMMRSAGSAHTPFTTSWEIDKRQPMETFKSNRSFLKQNELWQNGSATSEASLLLFDQARTDAALESTDDSSPDVTPIIIEPTHKFNSQQHLQHAEDDVPETQIAPGTGGVVGSEQVLGKMGLNAENVNISARPTLCRLPKEGAPIAKELVTGDALSSGVGPAAWFTSNELRQLSINSISRRNPLRTVMGRIADANSLALTHGIFVISDSLGQVVPLPPSRQSSTDMKGAISHGLAFHLSEKEVLRWHRAGKAFARLEATGLVSNSGRRYGPAGNSEQAPNAADPRLTEGEDSPRTKDIDNEKVRKLSLHTASLPDRRDFSPYFFFARVKNFDTSEGSRRESMSFTILMFLGGVYAGVHLGLWTYQFPTFAESVLWKLSACALGAPLALIVAITVIVSMVGCLILAGEKLAAMVAEEIKTRGSPDWQRTPGIWHTLGELFILPSLYAYKSAQSVAKVHHELFKSRAYEVLVETVGVSLALLFGVPMTAFGVALTLAYLFGRVFIIVEAFLSLRHVPVEVYQGITWAQYIPHF